MTIQPAQLVTCSVPSFAFTDCRRLFDARWRNVISGLVLPSTHGETHIFNLQHHVWLKEQDQVGFSERQLSSSLACLEK